MSISDVIYRDPSFVNIGDLPTGFGPYSDIGLNVIYARPFRVSELYLLHASTQVKAVSVSLDHILRAVNICLSCDVNVLTDGDFEYILAWLRKSSYPEGPLLVKWKCKKRNVVFKEGRNFYEGDASNLSKRDMLLEGLEYEICDAENNEIVHNAKVQLHVLDDEALTLPYDFLDFPRVKTLIEYFQLKEEQPGRVYEAGIARWIKEGETLKDKIDVLMNSEMDVYEKILECRAKFNHGITEAMELRCRTCGNKVPYTSNVNPRTFFADNSEKNVMDMQYTLLSEFGMQPDDSMLAKKLLYIHSCLAKDKIEQAENERTMKALRGVR